ncbi:peptidyl-prolyl cis-trans isomerase [Helicobacter saguini]|uniref:peptidyl-prolyl cis-trans isomerase n=1 Tax=Helicobacter saguini TaxID=1548018 RepID=UPI000514836F|nr:peptidyl-prolyl cis-trans isomerase [Helicobacter saguini]
MKIFVLILLCFSLLFGVEDSKNTESNTPNAIANTQSQNKKQNIVGGIALFVNGEPITLYSIQKTQKLLNTDRIRATDFLIMEKLRQDEIKRLKIDITESQIDAQISQIAQQNHMSLEQFYAAVSKEGMNLSEYREKLKEQILTQELMRKILFSSNVGQEDELRKYYNEHKEEFIIPKSVAVSKFVSNNRESLEAITQTNKKPKELPNGVVSEDDTIDIESLNAQIADVMLVTPQNSFTQILETGDGGYVVFFINKKLDTKEVDFNQAKNYIAQKLIASNQEKILSEYFERVRSRSKIVFIR